MIQMMRHPKTNKPILNHPLCVDDFGNLVYRCKYTQAIVTTDVAIFIGPCLPQLNGTYVCAPDAWPVFKKSARDFAEMDANCNTCRHLARNKPPKNPHAPWSGMCLFSGKPTAFHPDDWMGMECWSART